MTSASSNYAISIIGVRSGSEASRRGVLAPYVADPKHGPLPALLLMLTFVVGVVDALSILALGRVFVANMTGNVVFTGFAIVDVPGFSLAARRRGAWPPEPATSLGHASDRN